MLEFHIGNLYTKIDRKKATKEELNRFSDLLAVKIEGAWFSKAYKMGRWDGKKKFFNRGTCRFYTGLLGYAKSNLPDVEIVEIDERIPVASNNLPLSLNGIELWDYQKEAIYQAIRQKRGIIASPTNSGKTEIACGIIKVLGLPANFITHRRRLLWQTKKRFEDRLGIEVGIVGDQVREIRDINILSIHTIAKRLKEEDPTITALLENTSVVFSDECHHVSAGGWEGCLKSCTSAYYRFGLSATPLMRDSVSNMTVLGLTGDEIITVTDQQLTDWGISAYPSVFLYHIGGPKFPKHYPYEKVYEEGVIYCHERNEFIVETAKRWTGIGKSVFIIVFIIKHGEHLTKLLNDAGVKTEFISGKGNANDDAVDRFARKELLCIVSSNISDEGLDVPAIDVLIPCVEDKSILKVVQRVGRGRRKKKEGENVVIIVDFIHTNNPHLKKHSKARLEQYEKMKLPLYEVVKTWDDVRKL